MGIYRVIIACPCFLCNTTGWEVILDQLNCSYGICSLPIHYDSRDLRGFNGVFLFRAIIDNREFDKCSGFKDVDLYNDAERINFAFINDYKFDSETSFDIIYDDIIRGLELLRFYSCKRIERIEVAVKTLPLNAEKTFEESRIFGYGADDEVFQFVFSYENQKAYFDQLENDGKTFGDFIDDSEKRIAEREEKI
jgi:hypothetical protein